MKLSKKVLSLALAAAMAAGALSGCGGSKAAETTAAPTSQAAGEAASGGEAKEAEPAGEIQEGGSLVIAIPQTHNTFFMPQSTTTSDRFGAQPVLESLGRADAEGNYYPWLAEEFITDADALTFTVKLRDGVKFTDGSDCNAEVVAWNIQQYIDNGKASEIGSPKEIRVVDDKTVEIQYESWANNWDNVIGDIYICSKEAYDKNGEEWCKTHAVGTGPFLLESFVTDNKITYTKNENYRIEGLPHLDRLEIDIIMDTNTMMSALLNNEVGVAMKFENEAIINSITQAGFESIGSRNANVADIKHIIWNSKSTEHPMGDLRVRQAVMHAIQWDDVAKALSGGMGEATPLFCTSDSWAYSPDAEFYEYNLDTAKELLAEAGYPNGFETTIYTKSTDNDTATAFQAILAQIGITAKIEVMDSSALAAIQKEDDIDGFIANRGSSKMDFTNNYIRLYSSEGIKNHGIMLRPAEFEEPLFAARAAKTIEEKKENLQKAAKALVQDYVMITPMAVVYYQTFAAPGLEDSGIYDVSLEQWTPETVHWTK
ncbi:MAG: ABC transporter substrate-binding protein [Lachnospiraceae bacterium]|nr:ABC transporter substrate-binding protein [Lachnospiraceae bacterium]MDO5551157.1 ABC transporter substrate-binding protein [Lachnospiraceae bacterium]